jgi:hypothetical protein
MAVKRRKNKRRDELTENARAWLEGQAMRLLQVQVQG